MVINVKRTRKKKANYFITTDEAKLLWKYSARFGPKFRIMMGLALFRGMRIGEIVACNVYDFTNGFEKLKVILQKSYIVDDFPILKEFAELVKEYVRVNMHTFKDGYLFPSNHANKKHMCRASAITMFHRLRALLVQEGHVEFSDAEWLASATCPKCRARDRVAHYKTGSRCTHCGHVTQEPLQVRRHRVSWHSTRRWFETALYEQYRGNYKLVADIMRYIKPETVFTYINPYTTWKNEHQILEDTFGGVFKDFNDYLEGQTRLQSFL